jgi:hypothetical protein
MLTYDTSTSLAEAAAFYQEQIPGLGWATDGDPSIAEAVAFLSYRRENQTLTIILKAAGDKTRILIALGRSQE